MQVPREACIPIDPFFFAFCMSLALYASQSLNRQIPAIVMRTEKPCNFDYFFSYMLAGNDVPFPRQCLFLYPSL